MRKSQGIDVASVNWTADEFLTLTLDDDSIKTDFRLDKIKEALQKANANWVTVSVKEQLFGITD